MHPGEKGRLSFLCGCMVPRVGSGSPLFLVPLQVARWVLEIAEEYDNIPEGFFYRGEHLFWQSFDKSRDYVRIKLRKNQKWIAETNMVKLLRKNVLLGVSENPRSGKMIINVGFLEGCRVISSSTMAVDLPVLDPNRNYLERVFWNKRYMFFPFDFFDGRACLDILDTRELVVHSFCWLVSLDPDNRDRKVMTHASTVGTDGLAYTIVIEGMAPVCYIVDLPSMTAKRYRCRGPISVDRDLVGVYGDVAVWVTPYTQPESPPPSLPDDEEGIEWVYRAPVGETSPYVHRSGVVETVSEDGGRVFFRTVAQCLSTCQQKQQEPLVVRLNDRTVSTSCFCINDRWTVFSESNDHPSHGNPRRTVACCLITRLHQTELTSSPLFPGLSGVDLGAPLQMRNVLSEHPNKNMILLQTYGYSKNSIGRVVCLDLATPTEPFYSPTRRYHFTNTISIMTDNETFYYQMKERYIPRRRLPSLSESPTDKI